MTWVSASTRLAGKRVVIVEEEGIVLMHLHRIFTRAGMVVVGQASTAEQAVETILREKPDLVTMDIALPGISGIEATRHVTAQFPTCVVMTTAFNIEAFQQQAEDAGACGYILKPFTFHSLIAQLEVCYVNSQQKPERKDRFEVAVVIVDARTVPEVEAP